VNESLPSSSTFPSSSSVFAIFRSLPSHCHLY
jgi:hypothetical protein